MNCWFYSLIVFFIYPINAAFCRVPVVQLIRFYPHSPTADYWYHQPLTDIVMATSSLVFTADVDQISTDFCGNGYVLVASDYKILPSSLSNGDFVIGLLIIVWRHDHHVRCNWRYWGHHCANGQHVSFCRWGNQSNIEVTFCESSHRGVGTIAIHSGSADLLVVESYNTAKSTNLAISVITLTINPTINLLNSNHYYMIIWSSVQAVSRIWLATVMLARHSMTLPQKSLSSSQWFGINVMPERYSGPAIATGWSRGLWRSHHARLPER